ncbi:MAG: hypothetical protein R3A47_12270 [Polyangiales bacterium]
MSLPPPSDPHPTHTFRVESGVTSRRLVDHSKLRDALRIIAGSGGLDRVIDHPRIQKSGMPLVGHFRGMVPTRVQIFGETEMSYLESLAADVRTERLRALCALGPSLLIVTCGTMPMKEMIDAAREYDVPLLVSSLRSSQTIQSIT